MKLESLKKEIESLLEDLHRLNGNKELFREPNIQDVQLFRKKINDLAAKLTVLEFLMLDPPEIIPEPVAAQPSARKQPVLPASNSKTDLKSMIGLNDRFRFVNELFGGSPDEFNAALNQLNTMESYSEAEDYLDRLGSVYNWKEANHALDDLILIIKQKLS